MLPPTLAEAYLRCSRFPFLPFAASLFAKCEVDMFLQALRNAGTSGFQQHKKGVSYNCIVIVVVECCRCFVDFFLALHVLGWGQTCHRSIPSPTLITCTCSFCSRKLPWPCLLTLLLCFIIGFSKLPSMRLLHPDSTLYWSNTSAAEQK